jgi:FkbM family methyltransferase
MAPTMARMHRPPPVFWHHPVRSLCRYAVSVVRTKSRRTALATARIGGATLCLDLGTPTGLGLYRYGYRGPELEAILGCLSAGDAFIDGGANVGLFAIPAARRVGTRGRVLACEPLREASRLISMSAATNGFDQLEVIEAALSDSEGTRTFYAMPAGGGTSSFSPDDSGLGTAVSVATTTLDALVRARALDRVALVKLDVEGAELAVLRGATELLSRRQTAFFVEVEPSHLRRQGAGPYDIFELFHRHGYDCTRVGAENYLFHPGPQSKSVA